MDDSLGVRFTVAVEDVSGVWQQLQKVGRRGVHDEANTLRLVLICRPLMCPRFPSKIHNYAIASGGARPIASCGLFQQVWAAGHGG